VSGHSVSGHSVRAKRLERFSAMSVLVIDDNAHNVALLSSLLKAQGLHRVSCETDARRISGALPQLKPDLVLLDLHMPHVDGYAVLDEIRAFAAGTYLPVLVLTADVTSDARNRALAHGARDFLTKPLDVTEVTLRVANLLETRELYAALRRTAGNDEVAHQPQPAAKDRINSVLSNRDITPVFAPVVDLATHSVVGYEALATFEQPHIRGCIGWFDDAFQVGLGVELEWLAVMQALPFLELIRPERFLALSMSPATILHMQRESLCSAHLSRQIVIELAEHLPTEDYSSLHDALRDIRADGARLAMYDLGSGYAGFRHLIALQPDIIKLDKSLVSGIHHNRSARSLARALVGLASEIGAVVLAEGVEGPSDLAELRDLGVHWGQGDYLGHAESRPQDA
jgi:EAL domain-containing protein (putative c-di-GMP-specific phosphodiesterase class I)/FixJ family two-component response regulator